MAHWPGYTLHQTLHESSRSTLVRATRLHDGSPVILKFPSSDNLDPRRALELQREFAISRHVEGEGILRALGLEQFSGRTALVLEDFGGISLRQLLDARGPLNVDTFLDAALSISSALGHIHRQGIIHKDIKPQNIIINPTTAQVKIADFSLSAAVALELLPPESPSNLTGTLAYMAPEQTGRMNRGVDYRADFYSLGATFFELLTGRRPFVTNAPLELLHAHIALVPPSPREVEPGLPEPLAAIVLKLLSKDPESRYQSAWGLISDLKRCHSEWWAGSLRSFPLGTEDRAQQFRLPQNLYGRASEVALLLETHARAASGPCQLLLVTGAPGSGKSSLVNELHRVTAVGRGRFATGKCDQLHRGAPFDALQQALRQLVRQTLAEGETEARLMRDRLQEALGANLPVLAEVLPDTRALVGDQPPPLPLPASESSNRVQMVLARTLQAFASPERPLVLFLDDLQWAGAATLSLLQTLARDPDSRQLLLVGTYRDSERSASHPLSLAMEELNATGTPPRMLHLGPLGLKEVSQMICEATAVSQQRALGLAQIVQARTGGNPFAVKEFLRFLHERGLLRFNTLSAQWEWELDRIQAQEIPDNVAGLMAMEIRQLPPETGELLQTAACLGVAFDFRELTVASGATASETAGSLWSAIERGLVLPLSKDYILLDPRSGAPFSNLEVPFRFLHDRVRQAAYSLIAQQERAARHVRIGLRLLEDARASSTLEERAFSLLPHLGHAPDLIGPASLRLELADLHLRVGRRAKTSGAYMTALELLETGIRLLPPEAWEHEHERAFTLHIELVESQFLAGQLEAASAGFSTLLARARDPAQQAMVLGMQATLLSLRSRYTEALSRGFEALQLLGVGLSSSPDDAAIGAELRAVAEKIGGRSQAELSNLPRTSDPKVELTLHLLVTIATAAYIADQRLFTLVVLRLVKLSLEHGNNRSSPFGYVIYGLVQTGLLDDPLTGRQFGLLASELAARFQDPPMLARVRYVRAGFIDHWTQSARTGISELTEAYKGLRESGDPQTMGHCITVRAWQRLFLGDPLPELLAESRKLRDLVESTRDLDNVASFDCLYQTILMLTGEEEVQEHVSSVNGLTTLVHRAVGMAERYYLLRQPEQALTKAEEAAPLMSFAPGLIMSVFHAFYSALSAAAVYPNANEVRQRELLAVMEQQQAYLEKCARRAPVNYGPHHLLASAELARVKGLEAEASSAYERAIAAARANGFTNVEALSCELASQFHADQDRRSMAFALLLDSLDAYNRWGATGKARRLVADQALLLRSYGTILNHWDYRSPARSTGSQHPASSSQSSTGPLNEMLDITSVMKASQAISSELLFPQLVASLIQIVMESAGAQRGVLVLKRGEDFFVEALGEVGSPSSPHVASQPLEQSNALCFAIAQQVLRTGAHVLLDDACVEEAFRADPYIRGLNIRSVLCAPILHRQQAVGLFYLENNLTPGAFNTNRLKVLGMLSAQAAISIENAGLFRKLEEYSHTLEQRVHERTDELRQKNIRLQNALETLTAMQLRIITQEKLASLGQLTAGIAHELRNPLNFVNSFSELSLELLQELHDEFGRPQPSSVAQWERLGAALKELTQNSTKVREHGLRASNIIEGMLQHARNHRGEPQLIHLKPLLEEVIGFVHHSMQAKSSSIHIPVETSFDPAVPPLLLVPEDMRRVILNLVDNACYAAHKKAQRLGGSPGPMVEVSTHKVGDKVEIRIRDNGDGVPSGVHDKLFTPFFTTKPPGEGTGLGLSISHDIVVLSMGGELRLESEEGRFAEFIVSLPANA